MGTEELARDAARRLLGGGRTLHEERIRLKLEQARELLAEANGLMTCDVEPATGRQNLWWMGTEAVKAASQNISNILRGMDNPL